MAQRPTSDPGFGIKYGRTTGRIVNRNGELNVLRRGETFHPSDVYHMLLTMSWTKFFAVTVAAYIIVNVLFGVIYMLLGTENILHSANGDWYEELGSAMFFSAQTLTTVGYGNLAPGSAWVSLVSALEAMAGLFIFGIFTGLAFGRFSRIKPRILFSEVAVVAPYKDEKNGFMLRLANERDSAIMDARATLFMVMQDENGSSHNRRYYELPLELDHLVSLALNWTLVHAITLDSPLYGISHQDLIDRNAEFLVILNAFDDTVGQHFYSRYSYKGNEVAWGSKFEQMFTTTEHGDVELHIEKMHHTTPAELY
jgi:inward rectifier potassium channel